jgi:hypothetical protein
MPCTVPPPAPRSGVARPGEEGPGFRRLSIGLLTLALLGPGACTPPDAPASERAARSAPERLVAADGSVDWNRYYTADETYRILRQFEALYPELTEVYSIGKSYLGADLWVIEITNKATGPALEKPGFYLDGGLHSGELTGSAVATYAIGRLLNGYGSDPQITRLLDTMTFYVRPKFNPDGSDLVLATDQSLRSSVRPVDEDGDGLFDEDPNEDLDGDGRILTMRVEDPDGNWVVSPEDPRLMDPRLPDDPCPCYTLYPEGIDNDGDGLFGEDGTGGLDMNRNYPRNWEREHIQQGSGEFPLSEPETHAAVRFITDRPNITGIVHGHTSGGFVYRLPSAVRPQDFPEIDLSLIVHLGEEYTRTTGRPVVPSSNNPLSHRHGTLISWGFWDRGIIGWVPEYVEPAGWVTDYDGDGVISDLEQLRYNEEELGGRYFQDWTPFDHPQLGRVEIGGWWTRFWRQNTPPELLDREVELQMPWILYLAEQAPRLSMAAPVVTSLGEGRFRVEVEIRNEGYLPTSLTDRGNVGRVDRNGVLRDQVVPPPTVTLQVEGGTVEDGPARRVIPHLGGSNPFLQEVTVPDHTVSWTVNTAGGSPAVRVVAASVKGGTVRSDRIPLR